MTLRQFRAAIECAQPGAIKSSGRGTRPLREARGAGGSAAMVLLLLVLIALVGLGQADEAPKVEVYSRRHANPGEENVLNCFVSGFHPPKIEILLLRNGEPMSNVQYADMSFNDKWYFQRLVYADFTPQKGDVYSCRVTHSAFKEPQFFRWDTDF